MEKHTIQSRVLAIREHVRQTAGLRDSHQNRTSGAEEPHQPHQEPHQTAKKRTKQRKSAPVVRKSAPHTGLVSHRDVPHLRGRLTPSHRETGRTLIQRRTRDGEA